MQQSHAIRMRGKRRARGGKEADGISQSGAAVHLKDEQRNGSPKGVERVRGCGVGKEASVTEALQEGLYFDKSMEN
jgi:hypothetical protein